MSIIEVLFWVGVGVVGTLVIEHGWGWVLAKYHAWRGQ